MFCYNMITVSICHFGLVLVRSHPRDGGRVGNTPSFHVPIYHCNKTCMFIQWYLCSLNFIHTFICTYLFPEMLHVIWVYDMYMMYPMEGRHGDALKMRLEKCYTSFQVVPTGKRNVWWNRWSPVAPIGQDISCRNLSESKFSYEVWRLS